MSQPMDDVAIRALNRILAKSVEERKEYGGMIYEAGHYMAMDPLTDDLPTRCGLEGTELRLPAGDDASRLLSHSSDVFRGRVWENNRPT